MLYQINTFYYFYLDKSYQYIQRHRRLKVKTNNEQIGEPILQLNVMSFKQQYTLKERKQKFLQHKQRYDQKVCLIIQRHPHTDLPPIVSRMIYCPRIMINRILKQYLTNKINEKSNKNKQIKPQQVSLYAGEHMLDQQQTVEQTYDKYKDEDGFLYIQYAIQKSLRTKQFIYNPYFPIVVTIAGVAMFAVINRLLNSQLKTH